MAKSKSKKKIIVVTILGVLLVGGPGGEQIRQARPAHRDNQGESRPAQHHGVVVANGKIEPVVQVKISPEVSGEIIELDVKEGQNVKKGDLLFKIKPDNYAGGAEFGRGELQVLHGQPGNGQRQPGKGGSGVQTGRRAPVMRNCFPNRII